MSKVSPRLYLIFGIVFLVMHVVGTLAASLPYIFNAVITFAATLTSLLFLDRWYSANSFSEIFSKLGFHQTSWKHLVPGFVIVIVLLAMYPLLSGILDAKLTLHQDWALNLVGICLTGGLAEEIFFRGFLFRHLRATMTFKRAVWVSMLLFTVAHLLLFTYMPWPVALMSTILAVAMSLPLSYLFESADGTVWSPAILHAAVRTIGLVVTTSEEKFMTLSLLWIVACMVVPYLVLMSYRRFRMILSSHTL